MPVTEIAPDVYRISTFVPEIDLQFNQFLIKADEPLLFHTGPRGMFELVSDAVSKIVPVNKLRWITFGHVESDECGSMNQWLGAAPNATVAQGVTGCLVSLNDLADKPPKALADGEVLDVGGHRMRWIDTPHVPHGWEAGVLYDETTRTLLCGDLFTQIGAFPATTADDINGPANAAEDAFHAFSMTPATGEIIRRLATLDVATLAPMHAPAYTGDCPAALIELAAYADQHTNHSD